MKASLQQQQVFCLKNNYATIGLCMCVWVFCNFVWNGVYVYTWDALPCAENEYLLLQTIDGMKLSNFNA